jgi:hypothetical protein
MIGAATNQTISGHTHFDPETDLDVTVKGTAGGPSFLRREIVSVEDDFRYAASFDFSNVSTGTRFSVTVRHRGDILSVFDDARVV